jgi:hypothetical protein
MNDCILCHDSVLRRIDFHYLELDLSHTTADCEEVALSNRSVGFAEVWGEEDVKEGASEAFNGIGDRKDCYTLGLGIY